MNSSMGWLGVSAFQVEVCTRLLSFHVFPRKTLTSCIAVDGLEEGGWALSVTVVNSKKKSKQDKPLKLSDPLCAPMGIRTQENVEWWMDKQDFIGQHFRVSFPSSTYFWNSNKKLTKTLIFSEDLPQRIGFRVREQILFAVSLGSY